MPGRLAALAGKADRRAQYVCELVAISPAGDEVRGTGILRYGDETRPIRAGDVICCPTGGPETAHQIVNDSNADLAYLSVSTMLPAEVCEYPDSGKIGAFGGGVRHMTRTGDNVDYWTGET